MPSRRRPRRKTIAGNLTDVQKRLRLLEVRPAPGKIASKAVSTKNIALRAVTEDLVADLAVDRRSIKDRAVNTAQLEIDSVKQGIIDENVVTRRELAPDAVGRDEIENGEVTNAKLEGNITSDKIDGISSTVIEGVIPLSNIPSLPASQTTSGEFDLARIPDLPASQTTSGEFDLARIPDLPASQTTSGVFDIQRIPEDQININVDQVQGVFNISQIPLSTIESQIELDGDRITTGEISINRIPSYAIFIDASQVDSGQFDTARIPNLGAGKITSGTFDAARIPNLGAGKITSGTFAAARIPVLDSDNIGDISRALSNNISVEGPGIRKVWPYGSGSGGRFGITITTGTGATQLARGDHSHGGGTSVASHTHPLPGTSYAIGPSGNHAGHSGTNTGVHSHGLTLTGNTLSNTSTMKAKKEIQDHEFDPKKLLSLKLKKYKYKNEYRTLQENMFREWMYGYIAEEVQEAGIEEILGYDENGDVASLQYGTLVTLAIELLKSQQNEIDSLKEEIQRLKEKI